MHELSTQPQRILWLQPPNRLDAHGGAVLQQQIAALEPEQGNLWLIDLAAVEFIDSAGLFALVSALDMAQLHGCRLSLCKLRPSIKLVLEISQLDRVFEIVDDTLDMAGLTSVPPATAAPERLAA